MKAIQEAECLHGVRIVSKKEIFVGEKKEHYFNGKPMSQLIRESVLLPAAESYAPISQYIINSCKASGCSDQVDRFRVVLPTIDGLIGAAKNP